MQVDPIKLVGLKQAAFVSRCLLKGQSKQEIARDLGDSQLVDMWELFLKHNRWIQESGGGKWSLTTKGQTWISRVE